MLGLSQDNVLSNNLFAYCVDNPVINSDPNGYIAANVVGAAIGVVIGIVGGVFLGNWLADILKLRGIPRMLFVGGVSVLVGAAAGAIGYFIGPYVAKIATKLGEYAVQLMTKGKLAIGKLSASVRDAMGITKKLVNNSICQLKHCEGNHQKLCRCLCNTTSSRLNEIPPYCKLHPF